MMSPVSWVTVRKLNSEVSAFLDHTPVTLKLNVKVVLHSQIFFKV